MQKETKKPSCSKWILFAVTRWNVVMRYAAKQKTTPKNQLRIDIAGRYFRQFYSVKDSRKGIYKYVRENEIGWPSRCNRSSSEIVFRQRSFSVSSLEHGRKSWHNLEVRSLPCRKDTFLSSEEMLTVTRREKSARERSRVKRFVPAEVPG